jgi:hypothetical protein
VTLDQKAAEDASRAPPAHAPRGADGHPPQHDGRPPQHENRPQQHDNRPPQGDGPPSGTDLPRRPVDGQHGATPPTAGRGVPSPEGSGGRGRGSPEAVTERRAPPEMGRDPRAGPSESAVVCTKGARIPARVPVVTEMVTLQNVTFEAAFRAALKA